MTQDCNQENRQPQPQGYYPQPQYKESEFDLRELISIIWKGKWIIIALTFVFAVVSLIVALTLPNEYKATALVQPNEGGSGSKLSSLAGQFGGLASLAGINLGAGESSDAIIAMEILKSWGFAEEFINKHDLAVPLFAAEGWNQSTNELILDEELYDTEQKKWIRKAPKGKTVEPTSWELYEKLKKRVTVSQDKETGLISILVTHYSPVIAKEWADWLVQDINQYMRQRALKEANESIKYLEEQINQTSVAEIRAVFSELIQEQHKTKMLAQVSDEYVFKTVSIAKVAEEPSSPNRILIILLSIILGIFISLFYLIIKYSLEDQNS